MTSPGAHATLLATFADSVAILNAIPTDVGLYDAADDATMEELHRLAAEQYKRAGALMAVTAGQLAHRSAPELGSRGLAQRKGWRTPEEMAKIVGGTTGRDAAKAVRAGRLMRDTQTAGTTDPATGKIVVPGEPWLAAVGSALRAGLSTEHAEAIRNGLGVPSSAVPVEMLALAAEQLCAEATVLDPDRLYKRARQLRDELDAAGVGEREEERRARRSFKLWLKPDGMGRATWEMDPETAAIVKDIFDRATSPKRGGPRFGPTESQRHADRILDDKRTPEQLASDVMSTLLQHGVALDPSDVLGTGIPSVRVVMTRLAPTTTGATTGATGGDATSAPPERSPDVADTTGATTTTSTRSGSAPTPGSASDSATGSASGSATGSGSGSAPSFTPRRGPADTAWGNHHDASPVQPDGALVAHFEGQPDPISEETVARLTCTGATIAIIVDATGQPLDVGREQRLFTRRQRIALAARDGGCMWGDEFGNGACARPPSWCEAHHIEHWKRDGGQTNIASGILLCKHHHLLLHNNHWEIARDGADYWLVPPATVDPGRTPRLMATQSLTMRAFIADNASGAAE